MLTTPPFSVAHALLTTPLSQLVILSVLAAACFVKYLAKDGPRLVQHLLQRQQQQALTPVAKQTTPRNEVRACRTTSHACNSATVASCCVATKPLIQSVGSQLAQQDLQMQYAQAGVSAAQAWTLVPGVDAVRPDDEAFRGLEGLG